MKLIMSLPFEENELKSNYDYIILKKNRTIIKNDILLNDKKLMEYYIKQGGKYLIEIWEKYDGNNANIICGDNGGKLRPVHVAINKKNYKVIFQIEYCHVINVDYNNEKIIIYKNYIEDHRIIGSKVEEIDFSNFINDNYKNKQFSNVIKSFFRQINSNNFSYDNPLWADEI